MKLDIPYVTRLFIDVNKIKIRGNLINGEEMGVLRNYEICLP